MLDSFVTPVSEFQSTRLSRASTRIPGEVVWGDANFNPQGSREPRPENTIYLARKCIFQSTRLSRASTKGDDGSHNFGSISIHKALASLDFSVWLKAWQRQISIHKALASLDTSTKCELIDTGISIHKALASLDGCVPSVLSYQEIISIHKALASLDRDIVSSSLRTGKFQSARLSRASTREPERYRSNIGISIHKALASLDADAREILFSSANFNPQGSREPRRGGK